MSLSPTYPDRWCSRSLVSDLQTLLPGFRQVDPPSLRALLFLVGVSCLSTFSTTPVRPQKGLWTYPLLCHGRREGHPEGGRTRDWSDSCSFALGEGGPTEGLTGSSSDRGTSTTTCLPLARVGRLSPAPRSSLDPEPPEGRTLRQNRRVKSQGE